MEHFVYLISDHDRKHIHAGYTHDIKKCVEYYKKLNSMSADIDEMRELNRLVYLETGHKKGSATDRVTELQTLTLEQKINTTLNINPDWLDLSTVSNFNF